MLAKRLLSFLIVIASIGLTACANVPSYNYDALMAAKPRSILIMPPLNNSLEVNASYIELSILSHPIGEKGYYVFPVAVVNEFMKENGLPTEVEMNQVSIDKLHDNIGADAILYTEIKKWGQEYKVISSSSVVSVHMKLIDGKTGKLLWEANAQAEDDGGQSSSGLLGMLISAAVNQIIGELSDKTPSVARVANIKAIYNKQSGLLSGPYAPKVKEK